VVVFTKAFADGDDAVRSLAGFDVLVAMRERTRFPAAVLERLTGLRLLVSTGPANAAIDVAGARRHGITVCGTGYESHPAIEHTWALILGAARNLPAEAESMRSGGWQVTVGEGLHGKTLGLPGPGPSRHRSGAGRTGIRDEHRRVEPEPDPRDRRRARGASGDEAAAVHRERRAVDPWVLSKRTRGLVAAAELRSMKPSAVLVNTSRGPVVDEAALVGVMSEGRIRAAAIDVFDTEPLPADHQLRSLPNALLTGHVAYVTRDLYTIFYQDAVEDIAAYQAGSPIRLME